MNKAGETRSCSAGDKLPESTGDKLPESTGDKLPESTGDKLQLSWGNFWIVLGKWLHWGVWYSAGEQSYISIEEY